jgi:hypothetical protein
LVGGPVRVTVTLKKPTVSLALYVVELSCMVVSISEKLAVSVTGAVMSIAMFLNNPE